MRYSARVALALVAAAVFAAPTACARTLAELTARGTVSQCANPDALPHSSNRPDQPGFQIEIGRALAQSLGLAHQVDWIVPRLRAALVDCDLLLDTIVAPDLARGPLRVSRPYQRSGVALALRAGAAPATGFDDIAAMLRESLESEGEALALYQQLLELVEGRSIALEEFARQMIHAEELHAAEVDKMLRKPGNLAAFAPHSPN